MWLGSYRRSAAVEISDEKVGEGEAYMNETDPDKVLDHAAAAYQRGDLEKAKEIYAYIEQGGGTEHRDGNVRKSSAVAGFSLDSTHDAARPICGRRKVRGSQGQAFAGRTSKEVLGTSAPPPHIALRRVPRIVAQQVLVGRPPQRILDALPVRDVLPQIRVTVDLDVLRRLVEVLGARVAVGEPAPYTHRTGCCPDLGLHTPRISRGCPLLRCFEERFEGSHGPVLPIQCSQ